jgi:hypothetical protein
MWLSGAVGTFSPPFLALYVCLRQEQTLAVCLRFIRAGDGHTWGGLIACVVGGRGGVSCRLGWQR